MINGLSPMITDHVENDSERIIRFVIQIGAMEEKKDKSIWDKYS